jgi:uracil-DNA glycosylase family 4
VCGDTYFVRYDRYDRRTYRTCGVRCHNERVFHSEEARQKVARTMREQYLDGRRNAETIARRANDRVRELVAAGVAKIQHLTYTHLFALPDSPYLFDFCLPQHKLLIEVRGPGFGAGGIERALAKERLAKDHGYLVLNVWAFQVLDQPGTIEEMLRRILKNHSGEFVFVDAVVSGVEERRTKRVFPLYNIGVEDDESYVAAGVVSHNCRPPGNRNPEGDELAACRPFLDAQLGAIRPKVVLALGSVATQTLLGTKEPIGKLRGRLHPFGNAVLVPTFHPAFLLRNPGPEYRRMAWDDLKLARREYDARRTR